MYIFILKYKIKDKNRVAVGAPPKTAIFCRNLIDKILLARYNFFIITAEGALDMRGGNLHTHSVFCDGKDTPEALVKYALANGCTEIGFSGHSFVDIPGNEPFCMSAEATAAYKQEVRRLKDLYRDKIRILLGVEQDYYSPADTADYEYVIGSVHYIQKDGEYLSVDKSKAAQIAAVKAHYGGDFYAFCEDYYALVGDVYRKTGCNIVGHFDLVTKFNEDGALFDPCHPRYIAAADAALDALFAEDVAFEINFGAIARGYRKTPYPDQRILQRIKEAGKPLIYTSDCHDKTQLLLGIPQENPFEIALADLRKGK